MRGNIAPLIAGEEGKRLDYAEPHALAARLLVEVRHKQATIDWLLREMAVLKRLKFAASPERFVDEQRCLLD